MLCPMWRGKVTLRWRLKIKTSPKIMAAIVEGPEIMAVALDGDKATRILMKMSSNPDCVI